MMMPIRSGQADPCSMKDEPKTFPCGTEPQDQGAGHRAQAGIDLDPDFGEGDPLMGGQAAKIKSKVTEILTIFKMAPIGIHAQDRPAACRAKWHQAITGMDRKTLDQGEAFSQPGGGRKLHQGILPVRSIVGIDLALHADVIPPSQGRVRGAFRPR